MKSKGNARKNKKYAKRYMQSQKFDSSDLIGDAKTE
jgi:hypothetical protein